ncbi:low temperature requirement protein A [Solwaraspora sp. WMMD1047]|uniref:low temperature requirement protein A n=1 Tax=Solwaraspora sp. WMMD1047 TaxID=3016102 RepID=UPI002417B4E9|nr:low temperature requirement protein A [Solwaraspora sp. WMMD1047]MDG4829920.1 low temperature requirement protein A [Solwaraspora sp. WMMD1047]
MTINARLRLLREPGSPRRATFLELFFDLVFIVGLALVSHSLVDNFGVAGAAQALLMLMAFWWVWSVTALVTDFYDTRRPLIQVLTIWTMFGTLLMAAAVPAAFGERGAVFAAAYVAIHLGRGAILVPALRGRQERNRAVRYVTWFAISAVPWLIGGFVGGTGRLAWWGAALLLDYAISAIGYPLPRAGPVPASQYRVTAEHLAERYQQFFILALGDIILVAGVTFGSSDFTAWQAVAFVVAFSSAALLWRSYVHQAGELLSAAIESTGDRARFARLAPYTHLLMVAGVVAVAAAAKITIGQPVGDNRAGWVAVIFAGPVLFLIGRSRFEYEVFGRTSRPMLVAVLVLVLVAPVTVLLPPVLAAAVANLVLLGMIYYDIATGHRHPLAPGARAD